MPPLPEPTGPLAPAAASVDPASVIAAVPSRPSRALTWRSIGLGLFGVAVIAAYSDFNDNVVKAGPPLAGNQLPIAPLALALLAAAVWNPTAGRLWRRLRMSGPEIATALILMMVSVWLPGYGIYRSFAIQIVRPWSHLPSHPEWRQHHTLERLPDRLFPLAHDPASPGYANVYEEFETGMSAYDGRLPVTAAPWHAWLQPMLYWAPLLMLMAVALGALAVLVHRQWSRHEQLPYPIAQVYSALIPGADGRVPPMLRTRLFWLGVLPPVIFFGNNWLAIITHHFPWIPSGFWFNADIQIVFPTIAQVGWNAVGWVHFSAIGLAYFVTSEVGFSVGIAYMVFGFCAIQYYLATGDTMSGNDRKDTTAGAYLMYAGILLTTGRTYYLSALARAVRRLRPDDVDPAAPWAVRVLLLASLAMAWLLSACFGFDWLVAGVYVLALLLFFLVVTRVICETGIPFVQAEMDISMILANTLGFPFIGPGPLVMLYWLGSILNFDTRVCFMPFAANSLKVAESTGLRLKPLVPAALIAVALAVALGFAARVYETYAYGASRDAYHVLDGATDTAFRDATNGLTMLEETGRLEVSGSTHGLAKLALLGDNHGHGRDLAWMSFGAAGVLVLSLLRFRWPGFLLHPIIFVVWATWPAQVLWFGFLCGWAAKTAIVKFGGGRAYQAGKPFFLGLILGETMIAAFFILAQLWYYLATGAAPGSGYFGG